MRLRRTGALRHEHGSVAGHDGLLDGIDDGARVSARHCRGRAPFFTRYVVAIRLGPAVRIGSQPYGILPTAAVSRIGGCSSTTRRPPGIRCSCSATACTRSCGRCSKTGARRQHTSPSPESPAIRTRCCSTSSACIRDPSSGYHVYAETQITLFNRLNLQGFGARARQSSRSRSAGMPWTCCQPRFRRRRCAEDSRSRVLGRATAAQGRSGGRPPALGTGGDQALHHGRQPTTSNG